DDAMQGMKAGIQWSSAIVIWICALVCFFVSWLLLSGSKKMLNALTDNVQQDYLAGMQKIRLFTQIVGVISLITLCFSLITVLSMIMVNIIK
ncbi:MAG: hypothetical protein IJ748_03075, partial [Bacteroidales bacterium]|nr:hypothetical protein [Bacteroidales bacterium]